MARDAAIWTREVMTKENIEWLRAQPMRLNVTDETLLVHASPKKPEEWNYVLFYADATEAFQSFTERICFIGHSHQPFFIALMGDRLSHLQQREVRFGEGGRHLVNVGSVGQPRDRDWRAAYLVVDYKDRWMALEREPYDLKTAQEKILQVGAAPELAERLESGC
jgi:diadenosine tetraphosphatase ApaH/serine/threonine PP2A family protein phosphatase